MGGAEERLEFRLVNKTFQSTAFMRHSCNYAMQQPSFIPYGIEHRVSCNSEVSPLKRTELVW